MPSLATLTYDDVELKLGKILALRNRAVYDRSGRQHLYNHVYIQVQFLVNPRATVSPDSPVAQPAAGEHRTNKQGPMPGETVWRIRDRLLRPRKQLVMRIGNDVMIQSPLRTRDGRLMTCDANNGPNPISCDFVQFLGQKSAVGIFTIETWIPPCYGEAGEQPPSLLAHTWTMSEDISERFLSTRHVQGRAVFRADFLDQTALNGPRASPDDWRSRLFHPLEQGYRRTVQHISVSDDGTTADYSFTDEEMNWGVDPVTGIIKANSRMVRGYDWSGISTPSNYYTWTIDVWGGARCWSATLVGALHLIASTSKNFAGNQVLKGVNDPFRDTGRSVAGIQARPFHRGEVTVDQPGGHATFTTGLRMAVGNAVGDLLLAAAAPSIFSPHFPEDFGDVGGPEWLFNAGAPTTDIFGNPLPNPSTRAGRGQLAIRLVAQDLTGSCVWPPQPVGPPRRFVTVPNPA